MRLNGERGYDIAAAGLVLRCIGVVIGAAAVVVYIVAIAQALRT